MRNRAVWTVFEHQGDHSSRWSAIVSIAERCTARRYGSGCAGLGPTMGPGPGLTTDDSARMRDVERRKGEMRRANEIQACVGFLRGGSWPNPSR